MNPIIDKMLGLTADIAEELLLVKDAERDSLPDGLKLKIISLAELAAGTPDEAEMPAEAEMPEAVAEEIPAEEIPADADAEASDEAVAESAEYEEQADAEPESVDEPVDEPVAKIAKIATEDIEAPEAPEAPEANEAPEAPEAPVERPRIDPRAIQRAFSINDIFFFRREIFGGSKETFDEVLVRVAALHTDAELREYLRDTLNLNLDDSPGKEFYEKLEPFFV